MVTSERRRLNVVLTTGVLIAALSAGQQARALNLAHEPPRALQRTLEQLAQQARPGTLGIEVRDLESGRTWRVNADRAYPMMSVFKAPLGAAVLSQVDRGVLSLGQRVTIRRAELMKSGRSRIAATFRGEAETFTLRQLLGAAVSDSDNTAADVLLKLVGGPSVVTVFLRAHGIRDMRVDRGEDEIAQQFQVRTAQRAEASRESPAAREARLRAGYQAFLGDPRDRASPGAAVQFLQELWQGELLSPAATRLLLGLLYRQTIPDRLRAGIPPGLRLADKCGTSYSVDGATAAFNDIGVLTWPDGHTVIIAAFLTASQASDERMEALFEELARSVVADLHS